MEATIPPPHAHSRSKRALLDALKRRPRSSLTELARELGVSKAATLHHLRKLEEEGIVERSSAPEGPGRPPVRFQLRPAAAALFPEAYTEMSLCALAFIERELGREAVVRLLQQRTADVADRYRARIRARGPLAERVRELARVRREGGYMAEVGAHRGASHELLEHNCPILAIAERYPEACRIEQRLFEGWLQARVETTHRVVAGAPVCRFLLRPRSGPPTGGATP